jgi:hypothetical protein
MNNSSDVVNLKFGSIRQATDNRSMPAAVALTPHWLPEMLPAAELLHMHQGKRLQARPCRSSHLQHQHFVVRTHLACTCVDEAGGRAHAVVVVGLSRNPPAAGKHTHTTQRCCLHALIWQLLWRLHRHY